jgi:putative ABC transport system permease protein
MIVHLWKLIWNRKRANALILTELLAAFLVLATLGIAGAYLYGNYRTPIGIASADVWVVNIGHGVSGRDGTPEDKLSEAVVITGRLLEDVRNLPQVEAAASAFTGPYLQGRRSTQTSDGSDVPRRGWGLEFDIDQVSDDFARVLGLRVVRGRWFSKEDDRGGYRPVVINETMARDFFGDEDPIGKRISNDGNGLPARVVGVVAGYRQKSELAPPVRYTFWRYLPGDPREVPYFRLLVKARPGTGADFEQVLDQRVRASATPSWSFRVRRLDDVRDGVRSAELRPLKVAGLIAAFLMLMVVLGLTGVLWQNVTQRTREIGLRRAKGATRADIHVQILGELMVMTFLAVAVGAVLVAHVPFLNLVDDLNARVYLQGAGAAALALFALTALCGFYPARLAARIEPAAALRTD